MGITLSRYWDALSTGKVLSRVVSFAWGFIFVQTFRYILNKTYPFYSVSISLSSFATILGLISFLAFWQYMPRSKKLNKNFRKVLAFSTMANALIFLGVLSYMGEDTYLYLYPISFSLQIFIQLFFLSSLLPFFAPNRLSLLSGVLPGLFPIPAFQNPWFILLASGFMSVFPAGLLTIKSIKTVAGEKLLIPLRQSLDFLRFLLFAFALYGTFDVFRDRFFTIATILTLSGILQFLILKLHKRKEHIKYGLSSLAMILPILAFFYSYFPLNFTAAIGYTMLSAWEAVFFRRASEGYLRRERWLILIVFFISFLAYQLTMDWVTLIIGAMAIFAQLRFLPFLMKRYRRYFALFFSISIVIWSLAVYKKYSDSITRDFFLPRVNNIAHTPSILFLQMPSQESILATNLFPKIVVDQYQAITGNKNLQYESNPPYLLPLQLQMDDTDKKTYRVYHKNSLAPYATKTGLQEIQKKLQGPEFLLLVDTKKPPEPLEQKDALKKNLVTLGTIYAQWLSENKDFNLALNIYKEILQLAPETENDKILLQAAKTAAKGGHIQEQIQLLEKYVALTNKENQKISFKLMELYFYLGNPEKSEMLAKKLLLENPEHSLLYYRWLFRILSGRASKAKWQELQHKIRRLNVQADPVKEEKKARLLADIEEVIESNPAWYEIYQRELERTQYLVFPDF